MNKNELDRIPVFEALLAKRIKTSKTAKLLGLSVRQLKKRFKAEGPGGLVSKKVGNCGNRRLPQDQKDLVLSFLGHENHKDFGPILTHEYLALIDPTGKIFAHFVGSLSSLVRYCRFVYRKK